MRLTILTTIVFLLTTNTWAGSNFTELSKTTQYVRVASSGVSDFKTKSIKHLESIKVNRKNKKFIVLETEQWISEINQDEIIKHSHKHRELFIVVRRLKERALKDRGIQQEIDFIDRMLSGGAMVQVSSTTITRWHP